MPSTNLRSPVRERYAFLIPALLLLVASPASALTVYDFSSGGGTTHFAWGTYTDDWASDLEMQRRKLPELGTEVPSAQANAYAALAAPDATGPTSDPNRYKNPDPPLLAESTLIVEFNIAESPGSVTQLDLLWEGHPHDGVMQLYIWSYAAGNWSDGAGATGLNNVIDVGSSPTRTDFMLSGSITSNTSDYISGTGQITLLLYNPDFEKHSVHDYVSVSVTATSAAVCGNGVLETGEQCDDGNTSPGDCCSATCQFESGGSLCRASAGACDVQEVCTGSNGTCPVDGFVAAATECRAAAGICDVAEACSGNDPACPVDGVLDNVPCLDGDVCNGDELCVIGVCQPQSPLSCDDGDPCTADSCDAITGCGHAPIGGPSCPPEVPAMSDGHRIMLVLLLSALGLASGASLRRSRAGA